MKKMLCYLVFALIVSTAASASGIDVPKKIMTTFKTMYPAAQEVSWSYDDEDEIYIAEFSLEGNPSESIYKKDGTWIESSFEISTDDLPDAAIVYLEENHESDEVSSVVKFENPQETTFQVNVQVEKDDEEEEESSYMIVLTFDADGNIVDE